MTVFFSKLHLYDNTLMNVNKISSTSVVDSEMKNEHVTRRKTGYGVGDSWKDSEVSITLLLRVSSISVSRVENFNRF